MTAIEECSELIQKCRNMQLNGTLTKKENELLKRLENEWKIIYPICKNMKVYCPTIIEIFQIKNFKHLKKEQEKF